MPTVVCSLPVASQMMHSTGYGQKMVMATRVFGWLFLNYSHKSWAEYQRAHPNCSKGYYWQLHYTNDNPRFTLAEKLSSGVVSACWITSASEHGMVCVCAYIRPLVQTSVSQHVYGTILGMCTFGSPGKLTDVCVCGRPAVL